MSQVFNIQLHRWTRPNECAPRFMWFVHYHRPSDRYLWVLFPFNFLVAAYFIWCAIRWRIEGWIFRLEATPWLSEQPFNFYANDYDSPDARVTAETLKRYGYKRTPAGWMRSPYL